MSDLLKNRIAWAGLEFETPADWEVSRHSPSFPSGGLVMVDRRRQRMEVAWRGCDREPDLRRSLEDLRERFSQPSSRSEPQSLDSVAGWVGFWCRADDQSSVAHALHWQRGTGRLIHVSIVARREDRVAGRRLAQAILRSFRDGGGGSRPIHWQAFGIDCQSPPGWRLTSTKVAPMDVELQFRHFRSGGRHEDGPRATIRRLGMAATWFNGDMQAFVRSRDPELDFEFKPCRCQGHDALMARAEGEIRKIYRWLGRRRTRLELIWLCEPMNALFRVITASPPQFPLQPQDFELKCVPSMMMADESA